MPIFSSRNRPNSCYSSTLGSCSVHGRFRTNMHDNKDSPRISYISCITMVLICHGTELQHYTTTLLPKVDRYHGGCLDVCGDIYMPTDETVTLLDCMIHRLAVYPELKGFLECNSKKWLAISECQMVQNTLLVTKGHTSQWVVVLLESNTRLLDQTVISFKPAIQGVSRITGHYKF
ncbi:hypothetical protein F4801DRAFT_246704 [Xylaria longipes]|nr:hypothetical protein F4801DRAFT_246704 [Xylaria longipes]